MAALAAAAARSSVRQAGAPVKSAASQERTRYAVRLSLDFDARVYEGTQRVLWLNREARAVSSLTFHLHPNLRAWERRGAQQQNARKAPTEDEDEPRLEVTGASQSGLPLDVSREDEGATLRVRLREPVAPGGAAEVEMSFRGSVPEIGTDETSLPAHIIQQVGAVMRDTREVRRARDTNFAARGVMLMGSFHPVLAARVRGEWRRAAEPTVADAPFTDAADYEVEVAAAEDVAVYTSGAESPVVEAGRAGARRFEGRGLRGFALVAGRGLRAEERAAGGLRVRSVFSAEHEKTGRRVLEVAAGAARVFAERFGPLPFAQVTVAEAPLVAGFGSTEFAGLAVVASAFYLDFDSPAVRNLPEIVREQRSSVEDSLEFAVAQGVARQWWGASVGSDPAREPVLDEALTHWSALLYLQEARGEERAQLALEDQLRGVYQLYRTFGGEDMAADRPARDYRNSFQYAAVVATKGALLVAATRQLLGDERFFGALRSYYEANRLGSAEVSDLRAAFTSAADPQQRRAVGRLFERWLAERRGDEDIGPPNPQLAGDLGLAVGRQRDDDGNPFSRLGKFFWRQMTRIR